MSRRAVDLTHQRFGRLLVTGRAVSESTHRGAMWKCKCDCGRTTAVRGRSLRIGATQSCGCKRVESSRARMRGGARGMRSLHVIDAFFAPPEIAADQVEKTWSGAEDAANELARALRL